MMALFSIDRELVCSLLWRPTKTDQKRKKTPPLVPPGAKSCNMLHTRALYRFDPVVRNNTYLRAFFERVPITSQKLSVIKIFFSVYDTVYVVWHHTLTFWEICTFFPERRPCRAKMYVVHVMYDVLPNSFGYMLHVHLTYRGV